VGIEIGASGFAGVRPTGECVFFEEHAGRLCTIQRRGGLALLPSVCRHFPRVIVTDPRGASITLSHFCPTAAGLLFEPTPLAIVDAPSSLALAGHLEGLDATAVLPPLLARDVLMDWDGYSVWEEAAVAVLEMPGLEPEQAVRMIEQATEIACTWRPGHESLASAVHRAFAGVEAGSGGTARPWGTFQRPVKAFLAAHLFGSWAPYEGPGIRAVPAAVRQTLALLTSHLADSRGLCRETLIEAFRGSDLQLRHHSALPNSDIQSVDAGAPIVLRGVTGRPQEAT
jgi:hypothetical protein